MKHKPPRFGVDDLTERDREAMVMPTGKKDTKTKKDRKTGKRAPAKSKQAGKAVLPPEKNEAGFPVVGIGASAGGLEAFEQFFTHMPGDSGMPRSAVQTSMVDYVLPAEEMPEHLIKYAKCAVSRVAPGMLSVEVKIPEALPKIFILLRAHTEHDFSQYKKNTLCRRIERRMNVHHIDQVSYYVRYLQENTHELDVLFKELLIGVTSFFRDPEAFDALKEVLLKEIADKPDDSALRVWVPGCANGEEAYSTAIIIRECMDGLKRHFDVQVFGTDIDVDAIDTARAGIYPGNISADVDSDRLGRFFLREENAYKVRKEIREMLVFAPQSIIKDPPFTKLDLLCCRNL